MLAADGNRACERAGHHRHDVARDPAAGAAHRERRQRAAAACARTTTSPAAPRSAGLGGQIESESRYSDPTRRTLFAPTVRSGADAKLRRR